MHCARCKSTRIQRDFDDTAIPLRLLGVHRLLCNNCGLVFNGFDPLGKFKQSTAEESHQVANRRRGPRFYAHLPAAISLVEEDVETGKVSPAQPSRGHCEAISKFGMALSFVGSRFQESDLSRAGRLLFVRVDLPEAAIEAVVSIVTHDRVGEERSQKWYIGASIHHISEEDAARLADYLARRAETAPVITS
jgi:hypothetical protein